MSLTIKSLFFKKVINNSPVSSILIIPFVTQIIGAVSIIGYLSFQSGHKAVSNLTATLQQEVGERTRLQVLDFLGYYAHNLDVAVEAMQLGQIDRTDQAKTERYLWHLVKQKLFLAVDLGFTTGDSMLLERGTDGTIVSRLGDKNHTIAPHRIAYALDAQGRHVKFLSDQAFDPRQRPWFKLAAMLKKPIWGPFHISIANQSEIAINYSYPMYNQSNTLLGVINARVDIGQIHAFLKEFKVGKTGQIFIIERSGNMVASSVIKLPFIIDGKNIKRIRAVDIKEPIIRVTAQNLEKYFGDFNAINSSQFFEFSNNGKRYFTQVTPIQDHHGIDWLNVVVVPESDFMEQINDNTRSTIVWCIATLIISVILGWYTSRWITHPLRILGRASEAIANGNLEQKVAVLGKNELGALATSFNRMAEQLKSSFTTLENTNFTLEKLTVELKHAKEIADRANQAKSEFLGNISHELRTPLNGVLGYAQILRRMEPLTKKGLKGVEGIYECGSHLLTLINDVLDITKIEAEILEVEPVSFHLPSFLKGIGDIFQIRAIEKGIIFELQLSPQLPLGVYGDQKRLRQVLLNLLDNAIKFTDAGSVRLKAEMITQQTTLEKGTCYTIRFLVADTGVGMTAEQINKIFLPFERVGDPKKHTAGTGIGLAISQKIVALMQSQILVESQTGSGSTFQFDVELPATQDWSDTLTSVQPETIIGYLGKKRRILVVDDRWENRSILVNLLTPLGFEVIESINGQEGLNQALITIPDLIITDLAMPVMDGFKFLELVHSYTEFQNTIVLVCSASVSDINRYNSLTSGGNDFLPKPIRADILLELIQRHLQLEWVYDQMPLVEIPTEGHLASLLEQTQPPSVDILNLLTELVQVGDLDSIIEISHQISASDPTLSAFTEQLISLADNFEVKRLRAFIQGHFH